jgi:hypothetical protein
MIKGPALSRTQRAAGDRLSFPLAFESRSPSRKKITRVARRDGTELLSVSFVSSRPNVASARSDHGAARVARGGGERSVSVTSSI